MQYVSCLHVWGQLLHFITNFAYTKTKNITVKIRQFVAIPQKRQFVIFSYKHFKA